jgi:hypothetical protein
MARKCRYFPARRCFHDGHCGLIDSCGVVYCCFVHPNPCGFFTLRVLKPVVGLIWSKHALRRR